MGPLQTHTGDKHEGGNTHVDIRGTKADAFIQSDQGLIYGSTLTRRKGFTDQLRPLRTLLGSDRKGLTCASQNV